MSKRAEELARRLTGLAPELYTDGSWLQLDTQKKLTAATDLIDAELRKERERAAEQFKHRMEIETEPYTMMRQSYVIEEGTEAILSDEED